MAQLKCAECSKSIPPTSEYWFLFPVGVSKKLIYNPYKLQGCTVICTDHLEVQDLMLPHYGRRGFYEREDVQTLYTKEIEIIFSVISSIVIETGEAFDDTTYVSGLIVRQKLPKTFDSFCRQLRSVYKACIEWLESNEVNTT